MRIGNLKGRAVLIAEGKALDIATASGGDLPSDPIELFASWSALVSWAEGKDAASDPDAVTYDPTDLDAPSPRPSQVFGIGVNYADHAGESGLSLPPSPLVFTKFPSSVTGPDADVTLPADTVDWEAELVVVIGQGGRNVGVEEADAYIAGYTVGQDLSERTKQWEGERPQFSVGKSFEKFAPTGPYIVTASELEPTDLRLTTTLYSGGSTEVKQDGNTKNLIFTVPQLVSYLSKTVELRPGDLIFTGTPDGVGAARTPPEYLKAGDRLVTEISGIGTIEQRFTSAN